MIVITGAAGFIASFLAHQLASNGVEDLLLVDDFSRADKASNHLRFSASQKMDREAFPTWFALHASEVKILIHLGARTDTTEMDYAIHERLNVAYSKKLWLTCAQSGIPFIYASSAATYGNGELGYNDDHESPFSLVPLNPYGVSKNEFDKWALHQKQTPPFWAGLKFFNVYGPQEYHKGRMASVIFHAFKQISANGYMQLFRSHNPNYTDGGQLRDFVYVKDVVKVIAFLMEVQPTSGLYNLGTGQARTFLDLTLATFEAMNQKPDIRFIDTPVDIRDKYQYFTEANMTKLHGVGYDKPFTSLEEGVADYCVMLQKHFSEKR
jgi:ADP-L-glycero-D-manno-heptose 6-epimerase